MKKLVLALVLIGTVRTAHAQFGPTEPAARLQLEGQAYTGMPFGVLVVAEGFDEQPQPAQPALAIDGATVTPMGAEPQIQRISINGQRHDSVTWVFRYRVEAAKAGELTVGSVTVTQGQKTATARGGSFEVTAIETTDDMKIQVQLPERPLWLGEVAEVHIDWLLRRDVQDQQLAVPLLSMPKDFAVSAETAQDPRKVLAFPAGATDMQLGFEREQATVDGVTYTRIRFTVMVTPQRAGAIEVPPAQVVASLEVGQGRDQWGFPSAKTQLFRATDVARTLEVKPLPQSGRPASFAGAVGTSFSIAAQSSRSVVQLGEPVDLEITVRGDTRLDGLQLGALAGPGRLPADHFEIPDTVPPGEVSDDGKTKVFRVAVQVTDPSTREIPPIELAWFDPVVGEYRTTRSEPIALSVKGGSVIGAGDVVGHKKPNGSGGAADPADDLSRVDVDLALSAPGVALQRRLGGALLAILVVLLYAIPLAVLAVRGWQVATRGRREEKGEVAAARRKVDELLARAETAPARDLAAPLAGALRALARVVGAVDDPLLARIETEGYAPASADRPLPAELRTGAAELAGRLAARPALVRTGGEGAGGRGTGGRGTGVAALLLVGSLLAPRAAAAAEATEPASDVAAIVEEGRDAYRDAMDERDPTARRDAFARAADAFARAAAVRADSAELHADWGNAALGASDFGTATLAYRRALRLDPDNARALRNLRWLRDRLPANVQPRRGGGAASTLFFFQSWTRAARLVAGAALFALAVLLLVPLRRRPGAGRIILAAVVAFGWLLLTVSLFLDRDPSADGVVLSNELLRSADSAGAPAAMSTPLPPGAEITILETRDGWTRIRTSAGATGWLPAPAVATVRP